MNERTKLYPPWKEAQIQRQEARRAPLTGRETGLPELPNLRWCITVVWLSVIVFIGVGLLSARRGVLPKVLSNTHLPGLPPGIFTEREHPASTGDCMLYIATTESNAKVLVSGRCQKTATARVEQRLNTRVVAIDYLEAALHTQFNSLAYVLGVDTILGDVP